MNRAHFLLRGVLRSLLFVGLLLAAAGDCKLRRPRVGAQGAVWIHLWCQRIVRVLGFRCKVEGPLPAAGAVVSNHLSYLDILLYSSVQPFVMVAKTEVRRWPLLGWLTAQAGTVYVERGGGPKTYPAVNAAMAEAYRSGLPVLFFPEGTTTDGPGVLPFRRGLFHSVLHNSVNLRVATVRYSLEDFAVNCNANVENAICWWGDMNFAPHIFRLLGLRGVNAHIRFGHEVLERTDRFVLSETAHAAVADTYAQLGGEVTESVSEVELIGT
ncbi:MAG: 1-acyl-sn-glycerol-3-phosphate acyltransferase [Acidobacteriota bacterium]|nr:1-acyl-sn-glycerol-3-phosphate acyltransferase [Acidobacteriota bacterium]